MNYYIIGIVAGTLVAGLIAALLIRKSPKDEYDERQIFLRGQAFRHAFFAVLVFCGLYSFAVACLGRPISKDGVSTLIAVFVGVMVFGAECVFRDAFFSVSKKPSVYLLLFGSCTLAEILGSISRIREGALTENGLLTFETVYLAAGAAFFVIFVSIILKLYVIKEKED